MSVRCVYPSCACRGGYCDNLHRFSGEGSNYNQNREVQVEALHGVDPLVALEQRDARIVELEQRIADMIRGRSEGSEQ